MVRAAATRLVALIWLGRLGAITQCTAPEVLRETSSVSCRLIHATEWSCSRTRADATPNESRLGGTQLDKPRVQ